MSRSITNINIESYSEKAIVVRGNTKNHKETLINIGGKYNDRLKGGEGWIFPKSKQKDIENWIRTGIITDTVRNNVYVRNNTNQSLQIETLNKKIDKLEKLLLKVLKVVHIEEEVEEDEEEVEEDDEEEEVPRRRLLR